MKKTKSQDLKPIYSNSKNTNKPEDILPQKPKNELENHIFNRLRRKHNSKYNTYINKITDNLCFNKNTHLAVAFKDEIMYDFYDEFLKRYFSY